jgi:TPR repeat protein
MYERGLGVPKDYVLGYMWFNLAAAQGHEIARWDREELSSAMTPDQIAEAQRLARDWKPTK